MQSEAELPPRSGRRGRRTPDLSLYITYAIMYIGTEIVLPTSTLKHKHMRVDQKKLDRARKALQAGTETETVDRALDLILAEAGIDAALRRYGGKASLVKIFR